MLPTEKKAFKRKVELLLRCLGCHNHVKKDIRDPKKFCSKECETFYCQGKTKCRTCKKFKKCKVCSKCKLDNYCSKECQENNWKEHKPMCKKPIKSEVKMEYKINIADNQWVDLNNLKLETYSDNEVDILFGYAKFEKKILQFKESGIMIWINFKGKFAELIYKKYVCVQAIIKHKGKVVCKICSFPGILEFAYIQRIEKDGEEMRLTRPVHGARFNLSKEVSHYNTLNVIIGQITNTKQGEMYKLELCLCETHCKHETIKERKFYEIDTTLDKNQKTRTLFYSE